MFRNYTLIIYDKRRSSFFHILIKIPTKHLGQVPNFTGEYSSEQLIVIYIKMQSDNTHLNFFVSCSKNKTLPVSVTDAVPFFFGMMKFTTLPARKQPSAWTRV